MTLTEYQDAILELQTQADDERAVATMRLSPLNEAQMLDNLGAMLAAIMVAADYFKINIEDVAQRSLAAKEALNDKQR